MNNRQHFTKPKYITLALAVTFGVQCSTPATTQDSGTDTSASDLQNDLVSDNTNDDVVDVTDDANTDSTTDTPTPMCTTAFMFDTGSTTGHAQPLSVSTGQARAGRLALADLPPDPTGLAVYQAGDYVIANSKVAVLIEDVDDSDLYNPWGGNIVGLARVVNGRLQDAGDFNEVNLMMGRYVIATESVGVLNDGSNGQPAVVRAIGMLRPLPFLDEFARPLAPRVYDDLRVAVDYELSPDSDVVEVYYTFESRRVNPVDINPVIHSFFQADRMSKFWANRGFGTPSEPTQYVGFVDDHGMSYAWMSPASNLTGLVSQSGWDGFTAFPIRVPPCAQTRAHAARMVVGYGQDGVIQGLARINNQQLREITGRITLADGSPAVDAHIHATLATGGTHYVRTVTGSDGRYSLHVPADQAVNIHTFHRGHDVPSPTMVAVGTNTADVQLGVTGTLEVTAIEEGSSRALPVRIQVFDADGSAPSFPGSFGERNVGRNRWYIDYPLDGHSTLTVPPGRYRVVISRGYEYEISDQTVTVTANTNTPVMASLRHSVDTTDVMCGDFHIHTHRSPDASDSVRLKVAASAAEGLEIPVRSEHEFVADFSSTIQDMGLQQWLFGVGSIELTTFTWGHFGVVPLIPDPNRPNGGAFQWSRQLPPQVFAEARRAATQPTIIINHPSGGDARGAYFTASMYNPATGLGAPQMWDTAFTAVEVFNESDFERNRNGTINDWFGMLNIGRRVFAVGSSDSHTTEPSNHVGYPRTCMYLGTDDPRALNLNQIRDAVATGRSYVSGGIYLNVTGPNGSVPGQEIRGVGANATFHVNIQAPTWIAAERLEVIADGMSQPIIPLNASTQDPGNPVIRYNADITVPVGANGSYILFAVHADRDLAPVHDGKRPFAATNPFFVYR